MYFTNITVLAVIAIGENLYLDVSTKLSLNMFFFSKNTSIKALF